MSNPDLIDLEESLARECRERMARVRQALAACPSRLDPLTCAQRLYQEFDSLHGAARTVDRSDLEWFARLAARLTRTLRNRARSDLPAEGRALFDEAAHLVDCACGVSLSAIDSSAALVELAARMVAWEENPCK